MKWPTEYQISKSKTINQHWRQINTRHFQIQIAIYSWLYTFFFSSNEIDVRRSYTKKLHPLKVWLGPSIVKRRRRGDFYGLDRSRRSMWMRSFKQLKVLSRGEDDSWKRVLVSGSHRDIRFGESVGSIFIQFNNEGVLSVWKPRVSRKVGFRGDNWFQLDWTVTTIVSVVQGKGRNGSSVSQGVEWVS